MADPNRDQGTTRRSILGGLLGGLSLAAANPQRAVISAGNAQQAGAKTQLGTGLAVVPPAATAASTWSLRAVPSAYSFSSGTSLPFYRLVNVSGGTMQGNIPLIEATEGQIVTLEIENQLPMPVTPGIVGVLNGPTIYPGRTEMFSFTMPAAGSYMIGQALPRLPATGAPQQLDPTRYMNGFSAMLISRPIGGANELYVGGPSYDKEYFILFEDEDDRWNSVMGNMTARPPQTTYEPNYFMMNGLAYPDTASDASTYVTGTLGQRILIRMGNLGRMRHAIHFHGYHPEVVARENVPETVFGEKDTIPLPHRTTVDVILTANQLGTYLLHPHSLTAVTENGLYPWGQLTLITIS
ncbi:MAG: FtsP/CotA-like multicopper oxidase with cupredoxin domain [Glaciecola sp.]|jgi:FtsP/CotA-like multicopper oxidase with cupredoxin domain